MAAIPPIIGNSPALARLVDLARRFAETPHPILLVDETGTGKEVFARNIHAWSRCRGRFVDVNCGAFPETLMEGLLFGTRKGSYTGAENNAGLIAAASGGTLFLDELHHLPVSGQVKLLRVLETGEVQRLGDEHVRPLRFRLIAAVQDDINGRISDGSFRSDLFYRIAGYVLRLPSLAERLDDLMPLASYFAQVDGKVLLPQCDRVLRARPWLGNIRELRLGVQRAGVLAEDGLVTPVVLAKALAIVRPVDELLDERVPPDMRVLETCEACNWHGQRAAAALGISRITLWRRLASLGLSVRIGRKHRRIVSPVRLRSLELQKPLAP